MREWDYYEDNNTPVEMAEEALSLLHARHIDELKAHLHDYLSYEPKKPIEVELLCDAADALARGDLGSVEFYLRQCIDPKFDSIEDCQKQYNAAMGRV